MVTELQLLTTREFNGHTLDCYVEPEQTDKGDFWVTREQIGVLLGYADPSHAIKDIHNRNKERLDKFSSGRKLRQVEGSRTITRTVIMYDFKGLLEVCRYSQQPNANAVIDVLWEIADEIRRTGSFRAGINADDRELKLKELEVRQRELDIQAANVVKDMLNNPPFPLTDETRTVFGHEVFRLATNRECLAMLPESSEQWYTAGQIGEILGISANKVGRIAKEYGIKAPEGESNEYGRWVFTKSRYSNHECASFIYDSRALERFRYILREAV